MQNHQELFPGLKYEQFNFGKHYPLACEWWRAYGWEHLPKIMLPNPGGVVAENEGVPVAMCWLYQMMGVPIGWMEWMISDPSCNARLKHAAIECLVGGIINDCQNGGIQRIFTSVKPSGLEKMFQRLGFNKGDDGMVNLMWGG